MINYDINSGVRIKYKNVIISPHLDDAFFSLGGMMLNDTHSKQKVVDVFSVSNFIKTPQKHGTKTEYVTKLRKLEENINAHKTNVTIDYLDFADSPIRDASKDNQLQIKIARKLLNSTHGAENVYIPLAIGGHGDHMLVAKAALSILHNIKGNIFFYEDQPYAAKYKLSSSCVEKTLELSTKTKPLNIAIPLLKKLDLCLSYKSQITPLMILAIATYPLIIGNILHAYERVWPYKA